MKTLLMGLLLASSTYAFASGCGAHLANAWTLSQAERTQLTAKLIEHSGDEGKYFGDIEHGGNRGVHAYILDDARVDEALYLGGRLYRKEPVLEKTRNEFNPAEQKLVLVLETEDEPRLSYVLFTKSGTFLAAHRLEPVNGSFDLKKEELPQAWDKVGYYDHFLFVHHLLKDAEEVDLPVEDPERRAYWSIENYGPE